MTQAEFEGWKEFYVRYPFDDFHRFHRPAALVAQSLGGGEVRAMLDWLQPDRASESMSDADMNTMRAFGFARKG
jgi:hypothetical protein